MLTHDIFDNRKELVGVARHADAGYAEALDFAKKSGLKVPMAERTGREK